MRLRHLVMAIVVGLQICGSSPPSAAQEKPYAEASVWTVTFVRVKAGMADSYLRELAPKRKKLLDEAQKQGLITSHKILAGSASNRDDWDFMFMVEYKNWAALDGLSDKITALMRTHIGSDAEVVGMTSKRGEIREVIGEKVLQELIFK